MSGNGFQKVWLAVYTKPRHEKKADEQLRKKGIESYLPLVKQWRVWKDRKKWVWMPLFRSYIFVRVHLSQTLNVLQTHGVHHIVKFNNEYAVVSPDQIEAVKRVLEGGFIPNPHDYFELGQEVEIIGGPLRGIRGIVSRKDNEHRFVLKVDGIQQAISVQIDSAMLKSVKT